MYGVFATLTVANPSEKWHMKHSLIYKFCLLILFYMRKKIKIYNKKTCIFFEQLRLSNAQLRWDIIITSINETNDAYNHNSPPVDGFKYN